MTNLAAMKNLAAMWKSMGCSRGVCRICFLDLSIAFGIPFE